MNITYALIIDKEEKMSDKKLKFVSVGGYGWSGSGAVIDLLKEFDGYWECGREFRLLRDPYGIFDLENQLLNNWDMLNADAAINDFMWLASRLYRKTSRFGGTGCGYVDVFGSAFMEETEKYVQELTGFSFQGHWWWFEFKLTDFQMVLNRVKKRLHISDFENVNKIKFVDLSEQEFLNITKSYLVNLYTNCIKAKGLKANTIILDQAFPANKFEKANRYFDELKFIIVDRDPRDNFMDLVNGEYLIGKEIAKSHNIDKFIQYYKKIREGSLDYESKQVLYIKFEDLVLNYENTVTKILDFLEEEREVHINKFMYLQPEKSSKNIGMWKSYEYQDEIRKIEKELM